MTYVATDDRSQVVSEAQAKDDRDPELRGLLERAQASRTVRRRRRVPAA